MYFWYRITGIKNHLGKLFCVLLSHFETCRVFYTFWLASRNWRKTHQNDCDFKVPSRLRRRNLRAVFSLWKRIKFVRPPYAGEIWNRYFHSETHQMFSVHSTPEKLENATITGGRNAWVHPQGLITWLLWRHRFRKAPFSKCFPSTRKAGVFKFTPVWRAFSFSVDNFSG